VDTRHGFGLTAAEWAWQTVLAILMWRLRSLRGWAPICVVDNVFFIAEQSEADAMADVFVGQCELVGLPLHDPQQGKVFNAVGWDWDCSGVTLLMICPTKKWETYVRLSREWAAAPLLSIVTIEQILGLVVFLRRVQGG
jgi:hypothetical protein